MINPKLKKYALIGSLYASQYIPAWFLYDALPVFMRASGASLELIGILPTLALPITLSFLWSPLIDRYGFTCWGHYRFWIICFQILIICVTLACAFLDVKNLTALLIGMALMFILGASQDIATDALAVNLLHPDERGIGNAVQSMGISLGGAIGGGGMLILLNRWGWQASMLTLTLIMLVALIPIFLYREVQSKNIKLNLIQTSKLKTSYLKSFRDFYRRPGMKSWLLILILFSSSSSMAATMFRPLLVDIGLSLADIGWLLGVVSTSAGVVGGIVAGFLIAVDKNREAKLSRRKSLLIFTGIWALTMVAYLLPTIDVTMPILYLVAITAFFTIGMMNTTTFTIQMDKSSSETPGTDYTMQNSVAVLGSISAAALSGVVAKVIGYQGVFIVSSAIAFLSLLLVVKTFNHVDSPEQLS